MGKNILINTGEIQGDVMIDSSKNIYGRDEKPEHWPLNKELLIN